MRTYALVIEPYGVEGRRRAHGLAARGKDLVLVGEMGSLLDVLAAELRLSHRVDVRVLPTDPAEHGAIDAVVGWVDRAEVPVDRMISVLREEPDATRQARLREQLDGIAARLATRDAARLVGGGLWQDGPVRAGPASVRPSAPAPRARTRTAEGYGDPE